MNRRDHLEAAAPGAVPPCLSRWSPTKADLSRRSVTEADSTPSVLILDMRNQLAHGLVIISPCVSTPGARPPQGGLCFFPKP